MSKAVAGLEQAGSDRMTGVCRRELLGLASAAVAWGVGRPARAAQSVAIGAIFPLSGESGQVGLDDMAALNLMADIVNGAHAPIPMRLGSGGGLPRLGGLQLRLVSGDHGGNVATARTEAERLIRDEHVVAIIGSYQSATAAAISQVTERYGLPFISADNSSPSLHRRGLKWFFRTGPHDEMFTEAMFSFFRDIGAKTGRPAKTATLIYEDSIFGNDSSAVQRRLAADAQITIAADIKYRVNSASLDVETKRIIDARADVLMPSSYTNDAILLMRTMAKLGYTPPAVMSQAAGFQQQDFLTATGPLAEGVFSRSSFALDATASRPAIAPVNALLRARIGKDLSDNTSRVIVALQVLADAIDRAGSVEPEAIRAALVSCHLAGDETIMPWRGVSFDSTGQNVDCMPVVQQVVNGAYRTVYPFDVAGRPPTWNVGV